MMLKTAFIDTSAFISIFLKEEDAHDIEAAIISFRNLITSPVVLLETTLVLSSRRGLEISVARKYLEQYIMALDIKIIDVTTEIGNEAISAIPIYGKGYNNKAKLNFADLLSYACAKTKKAKLIYKGDDFIYTDIG